MGSGRQRHLHPRPRGVAVLDVDRRAPVARDLQLQEIADRHRLIVVGRRLDAIDDAWTNREATTAKVIPERLVIMGGGVVGVEMAQAFQTLGSQVTLVHRGDHVLRHFDTDLSSRLVDAYRARGIRIELSAACVPAAALPALRAALDASLVASAHLGWGVLPSGVARAHLRNPVPVGESLVRYYRPLLEKFYEPADLARHLLGLGKVRRDDDRSESALDTRIEGSSSLVIELVDLPGTYSLSPRSPHRLRPSIAKRSAGRVRR